MFYSFSNIGNKMFILNFVQNFLQKYNLCIRVVTIMYTLTNEIDNFGARITE